MMNCLGFANNNCYLWLLIILFVICCCGNGCIGNILDKLCGCGPLLPLLIVLLCCCGGGDKCPPREPKFPGCGCK